MNPHFRKGGKAKQGSGHLWVLADYDKEESTSTTDGTIKSTEKKKIENRKSFYCQVQDTSLQANFDSSHDSSLGNDESVADCAPNEKVAEQEQDEGQNHTKT